MTEHDEHRLLEIVREHRDRYCYGADDEDAYVELEQQGYVTLSFDEDDDCYVSLEPAGVDRLDTLRARVVSDADASVIADAAIGPVLDSHVTRAYVEGLGEPYCACGRRWSDCDGSRRGCHRRA